MLLKKGKKVQKTLKKLHEYHFLIFIYEMILPAGFLIMKKCDVILSIFYSLITNKKIKKMDVIEEYKLTSITFARYIAEIRDFLAERAPHLELIYNKS